jgi:hypothetical protein
MRLKPFFSYFGGKYRFARKYPEPKYETIIEPFAGAAGYALTYSEHKVLLFDVDEKVCAVWDYLIHVSPEEVLSIPEQLQHVDDLKYPQEVKWFVGFWLARAVESPRNMPSAWMKSGVRPRQFWGPEVKQRVASQLQHIRHWKVVNAPYTAAPDVEATWFVDPPYSKAGKWYRHKFKDYEGLGNWCLRRQGQLLVCEAAGADWLPFQPFLVAKATEGKNRTGKTAEMLFYREISLI